MTNNSYSRAAPAGANCSSGSTISANKAITRSPMTTPSTSSLSTPKFQSMPSPAFRQGGRGSKQVFAALDSLHAKASPVSISMTNISGGSSSQSSSASSSNTTSGLTQSAASSSSSSSTSQSFMAGLELKLDDRKYVLFNGRQSPCFARVVKEEHEGKDSILLQPLRPSFINSNLLIPWEGHLWSAKKKKTIEVTMKIHPSGELEVVSTPKIEEILSKKQSNQRFVYPVTQSNTSGGIASLDDNCDVISLESSEYDDVGDFSLFPQLATRGSNLNHRSSHVMNTSLITKRLLTESMPSSGAKQPYIAHSSPTSNHSIPKPHNPLTSTPSRTTSSSQALQKIKSSSAIKLPAALVTSSKSSSSKVASGLIPMNPLTMTPSSSGTSRNRKSREPTSASSQDCPLVPQELQLPGSQGSTYKESIAMLSVVNTPQSRNQSSSEPQSQCSSVQSLPQTKLVPGDFSYEDITMFTSLSSNFPTDDVVSSVASQLVEHMTDPDVSQLSAPPVVQLPSSVGPSSSSSSKLLPPSGFIRSMTPSQIILDGPCEVSRLTIEVPDGNTVLTGLCAVDLATPSNLAQTVKNIEDMLPSEETPVDAGGGSASIQDILTRVTTSERILECSTPMSCDSNSSANLPVNLNLNSNSRCVAFVNPSISPSLTSELGFDAVQSQSMAGGENNSENIASLGLPLTCDSRASSIHTFAPSPAMVTGIAMDNAEHESSSSNPNEEIEVDVEPALDTIDVETERVTEDSAKVEAIEMVICTEDQVTIEAISEANAVHAMEVVEQDSLLLHDGRHGETEEPAAAISEGQVEEEAIIPQGEKSHEVTGTILSPKGDCLAITAVTEPASIELQGSVKSVDMVATTDTLSEEVASEVQNPEVEAENSATAEDDQGIRPPLHPQSKKRKRKSRDGIIDTDAKPSTDGSSSSSHSGNASSSSSSGTAGRPTKRQSFPAAEPPAPAPARRSRQAASSSYINKRDAFLGSWPSRKQSAASGDWRI